MTKPRKKKAIKYLVADGGHVISRHATIARARVWLKGAKDAGWTGAKIIPAGSR
jgi:hypothetical protein